MKHFLFILPFIMLIACKNSSMKPEQSDTSPIESSSTIKLKEFKAQQIIRYDIGHSYLLFDSKEIKDYCNQIIQEAIVAGDEGNIPKYDEKLVLDYLNSLSSVDTIKFHHQQDMVLDTQKIRKEIIDQEGHQVSALVDSVMYIQDYASIKSRCKTVMDQALKTQGKDGNFQVIDKLSGHQLSEVYHKKTIQNGVEKETITLPNDSILFEIESWYVTK